MITRICVRCGKAHRLKQLMINKKSKYGRQRTCRDCSRSIVHFGGKREIVLKRDNFSCVVCGMTDKEHKKRWNKSITIDHIDKRGRGFSMRKQNNDLRNLQTLCLSCHGRKDKTENVIGEIILGLRENGMMQTRRSILNEVLATLSPITSWDEVNPALRKLFNVPKRVKK